MRASGTEYRGNPKVASITLTHPDKELFPEIHLTKLMLARYYEKVAPDLLRWVGQRPLSLVTCPTGRRKCFFQKHLAAAEKLSIPRIGIMDSNDVSQDYSYLSKPDNLIALVQLNVLEIHPWSSLVTNLDSPDRIIFDLDPGGELDQKEVIKAAFLVHDLLKEANLKSYVRCTGGKGLHVVAPIMPRYTWGDVRSFTKMIAELLESHDPKKFTAKSTKRGREDKIFVDYLRNGKGATAIGNYSTRAREGAPVAVPLSWDEIRGESKIPRFSIVTVLKRLRGQKHDPWTAMLKLSQKLPLD